MVSPSPKDKNVGDQDNPNDLDIIRLQLRKPKSWNWQLTTSKSSPHVALPTVQLLDYKGRILVEAQDDWNVQWKVWKSGDQRRPYHLKKSRSDTVARSTISPSNKHQDQIKSGCAVKTRKELPLTKCCSEMIGNHIGFNGCNPVGFVRNSSAPPGRESRQHQRSHSDDLFLRRLKHSSEESIRRAEEDGYRRFIRPHLSEIEKEPDSQEQPKIKAKKRNGLMQSAEDGMFEPNGKTLQPEVTDIQHKRYKTRSSSAGTLVIEETFRNSNHRRRRQTDEVEKPREEYENRGRTAWSNFYCQPKTVNSGLFYSRSEVFPFERVLANTKLERVSEGLNGVQRASSGIETIQNSHRRRKNRTRRSCSTDSVSLEGKVEGRGRTTGHVIKAHSGAGGGGVSAGGIEGVPGSSGGSKNRCEVGGHRSLQPCSDLLQLVRRLSGEQPTGAAPRGNAAAESANMGANVSRHSAKGLSGRRSRSSGSICRQSGGAGSGGGRGHPKGGQCSSLPGYLDDDEDDSSPPDHDTCNNNECAKSQGIDEVDRISTLGEGAPLHWKFSDGGGMGGSGGGGSGGGCDQGYGSERSPEEDFPPPLPEHHDHQCHRHLEPHHCYPFITPDSTFTVRLQKGSRGLGLSVCGGIDSTSGSWPGLVRVKRLFPHQPASACGLLNVGDLLLEANGVPLTGLTNYEALEVLRTASSQVELKVCRPPPDVLNCVSPISEVPPPPPRRDPPTGLAFCTPEDECYHGEFEITLTKIQGSLGFTLRKEDDSALGHYVRALVREPALTDGRIRAGDKIIAVNDVELCNMTHEQAVQFLRQCPEIVKLRLYRDSAQTPVATLSPSETTPRTSFSRKAHLRQEAVDMLNDLAGRKLSSMNHNGSVCSSSPTTLSPRRLRRTPGPTEAVQTAPSAAEYEQFHEGLLQKCSHPFDDDAFNSLFSIESDDGDKPSRPSSLDLYNPNQTPVAARKPRFNFSLAHNAYELNNLDAEVLDAPNLAYNLGGVDPNASEPDTCLEPASMPHIPLSGECSTTFSHRHPAYQSAHPQIPPSEAELQAQGAAPQAQPVDAPKRTERKTGKKATASRQEAEEVVKVEEPFKEVYEVLAIELNRGWNSRLGFSLQGAAGVTYVSAVHPDSVAAKDGRLRPGDRLIKVNDESIEHMSTSEIIDLLRIVRGPVCIVVTRVKSHEDCPKSNAEN